MAGRGTIGNYTHAKLKKVIDDASAAANVGGSDTQVQYNNGGAIGGASSLIYNDSSGDFTLVDDKRLYFGTNSDAFIEYNEAGDDYLTISGSLFSGSHISLGGIDAGRVDDSNGHLHLRKNNINVYGSLLMHGNDPIVYNNVKMRFGTGADVSHVKYNSTDEFLTISGSAKGVVLSGSTIQIAGTLEGSSPLKIAGEVQFLAQGDSAGIKIGPNGEAKLYYKNEADDVLVVSGSGGGTHLLGSRIYIDKKLGVGISGSNITHGITLPNLDSDLGQIKANAFISYSSKRYKEDIQKLENPLKIIQSLQGVSYKWKDSGNKDYGFIAEDVGKTLPGIVHWENNGKDAMGMDYLKVISFLVEAVKEQQTQIQKLNQRLDSKDEK